MSVSEDWAVPKMSLRESRVMSSWCVLLQDKLLFFFCFTYLKAVASSLSNSLIHDDVTVVWCLSSLFECMLLSSGFAAIQHFFFFFLLQLISIIWDQNNDMQSTSCRGDVLSHAQSTSSVPCSVMRQMAQTQRPNTATFLMCCSQIIILCHFHTSSWHFSALPAECYHPTAPGEGVKRAVLWEKVNTVQRAPTWTIGVLSSEAELFSSSVSFLAPSLLRYISDKYSISGRIKRLGSQERKRSRRRNFERCGERKHFRRIKKENEVYFTIGISNIRFWLAKYIYTLCSKNIGQWWLNRNLCSLYHK